MAAINSAFTAVFSGSDLEDEGFFGWGEPPCLRKACVKEKVDKKKGRRNTEEKMVSAAWRSLI